LFTYVEEYQNKVSIWGVVASSIRYELMAIDKKGNHEDKYDLPVEIHLTAYLRILLKLYEEKMFMETEVRR
jgi:hypothetical protein